MTDTPRIRYRLPGVLMAAALVLSACAQTPRPPTGPTCETNPTGGCLFEGAPVRVLPDPITLPRRPYQFFRTAQVVDFTDARRGRWQAPAGTLTDGASIPRLFTSIVGNPTDPQYRNAAALHDAYCGIGNEDGPNFQTRPWQDTHIMFFDGLIAGGSDPVIARIMFSAVWLGGPRWNTHRTLSHIPDTRRQQAMRATKSFIEANTLTAGTGRNGVVSSQGNAGEGVATVNGPRFDALLRYLRLQENRMLQEFPVNPPDDPVIETEAPVNTDPGCQGDDCFIDPTAF